MREWLLERVAFGRSFGIGKLDNAHGDLYTNVTNRLEFFQLFWSHPRYFHVFSTVRTVSLGCQDRSYNWGNSAPPQTDAEDGRLKIDVGGLASDANCQNDNGNFEELQKSWQKTTCKHHQMSMICWHMNLLGHNSFSGTGFQLYWLAPINWSAFCWSMRGILCECLATGFSKKN